MLKTIVHCVMTLVIAIWGSIATDSCYAQTESVANLSVQEQQLAVQEILNDVNNARMIANKDPLILDNELIEAATIRVHELPMHYNHIRPDGTSCFTVLRYHNAYKGENIAAGYSNAKSVMDGWMHSQGHRNNILNGHFTKIGIAYCYAPNAPYKHYWIQIFLGEDM